jgi:hypothetical protein
MFPSSSEPILKEIAREKETGTPEEWRRKNDRR